MVEHQVDRFGLVAPEINGQQLPSCEYSLHESSGFDSKKIPHIILFSTLDK